MGDYHTVGLLHRPLTVGKTQVVVVLGRGARRTNSSYGAEADVACLASTMTAAETDWDLLSSYAGLLSLACVSIYAGSHGSLSVRYLRLAIPLSPSH